MVILSEELIACKKQRDEYRNLAEQLEGRLSALKSHINGLGPQVASLCEADASSFLFSKQLNKLKDTNRHLQLELDSIRLQLADAESDSKLLREELYRAKKRSSQGAELGLIAKQETLIAKKLLLTSLVPGQEEHSSATTALALDLIKCTTVDDDKAGDLSKRSENISDHISNESNTINEPNDSNRMTNVEQLVEQLEQSQRKNKLLEKDLEAILDEKEELVVSRNEYKFQVEKLSEQIKKLTQTNSK